jgi:hypothetical protein
MAYKYTQYNELFRERAAESGFRYTIKELVSIIPSAIAHGVDTLLGVDGVLGDKDNYLHGPLGLLIGGPLALVGYLVGSILEFAVSLPSYLGRYLIDWPLGRLSPIFDVIMITPYLAPLSALLYTLPTSQPLPPAMRGIAGFLLGIVPELARYTVNRVLATFVSLTRLITDNLCDVTRFVYWGIGSLFAKNDPELAKEGSAPEVAPDPDHEPEPAPDPADNVNKKRRIKRAKDKDAELMHDDDALQKVVDQQVNLFEALGMTREAYEADPNAVKKAYRKQAMALHPDKIPNATPADRQKWDSVLQANNILTNPEKANVYLRHGNTGSVQPNRHAHFQPVTLPPGGVAPAAESKWQNDESGPKSDAPVKRRIIKRTAK